MEHEEIREKGEKRRETCDQEEEAMKICTGLGLCRYRVRAMQGYAEHRSEAVLTQDWGQCSTAIYVYK